MGGDNLQPLLVFKVYHAMHTGRGSMGIGLAINGSAGIPAGREGIVGVNPTASGVGEQSKKKDLRPARHFVAYGNPINLEFVCKLVGTGGTALMPLSPAPSAVLTFCTPDHCIMIP